MSSQSKNKSSEIQVKSAALAGDWVKDKRRFRRICIATVAILWRPADMDIIVHLISVHTDTFKWDTSKWTAKGSDIKGQLLMVVNGPGGKLELPPAQWQGVGAISEVGPSRISKSTPVAWCTKVLRFKSSLFIASSNQLPPNVRHFRLCISSLSNSN